MNIFNFKINIMDNIDWDLIKFIEYKCQNGMPLSSNEAKYYLSYVCFMTREKLSIQSNKTISAYDFLNKCDLAQAIIVNHFKSLNVECYPISTQKAITDEIVGHSFVLVFLPINSAKIIYLVDPTYTQFFNKEQCVDENFKVMNGMIVTTPEPGYFVSKLTEDDQEIIQEFLTLGFMELNEKNSKIYGDSFYKTKTGIPLDVSKHLTMTGNVYIKGFLKGICKLSHDKEELEKKGLLLEPVYKENIQTKKKAS